MSSILLRLSIAVGLGKMWIRICRGLTYLIQLRVTLDNTFSFNFNFKFNHATKILTYSDGPRYSIPTSLRRKTRDFGIDNDESPSVGGEVLHYT